MWFFRAVAFDLDGTLTEHDTLLTQALKSIERARAARRMVLVTGRIMSDLRRSFPGLAEQFDAVVTENGAASHSAHGERLLAEPVDPALDKALADRGVISHRGVAVLAIDGDAGTATEVVTDLGLDCHVVRNRGAAMILPAGVTKGSGLLRALDELGLSTHNSISIGDAENDLALLHAAEVGVAVANAVPSLAQHADVVFDRHSREAIPALLEGPLLAGRQPLCPARRWITIGQFDDGRPTRVPGSQASLLITGDSGAGKSYLAGLLAERWIDAGYSVFVVDREGDYFGLANRPGVHLVDAAVYLPSPSDLFAITRPSRSSLVLDLSGLSADEKLDYVRRLPAAISAERARHGIPHWVIHDEAHEELWADNTQTARLTVAEPGVCLVTWHPDGLPDNVRRSIDVTIAVSAPTTGHGASRPLRADLRFAGDPPQAFRIDAQLSPHVRHQHKYATTPLPTHRGFHFYGGHGQPHTVVATLEEFSRHLRHCDLDTLDYHLTRGDFSRWVLGVLDDHDLGTDLAAIERDLILERTSELERARQRAIDSIERRYLRPPGRGESGMATGSSSP
jgi:hydroxymethylpyrimidine pyrophosphatase-like HAD family hydrolase